MIKPNIKGFFKNKKKKLITVGTAFGLFATLLYPTEQNGKYIGGSMLPISEIEDAEIGSFPITIPTLKYGFALDTFQVYEGQVEKNQTLGSLLSEKGLDVVSIDQLVKNCKDVFDINRNFRVKSDYTLLTRHEGDQPDYLVLETSVYDYVVFHLKGDLKVEKTVRPVETKTVHAAGVVESSLWDAITAQGLSFEAAAKMEDALECSVDFNHTQKGDEFKVIYDENSIEGKQVGAGNVYAASYKREGKEYYAFGFDNGTYKGYFDQEGRSSKKGFLAAPLKSSRISSKFSKSRFHPILKYSRPHLGTDYAAPHGTPILAVGDGVVTEVAYGKGNGKYVKIKHDGVYQTQYLHMSRYGKGIRKGSKVMQGQVIGYVGSTGLATGPHVCFRFWKNGVQVNHLKLDLPKSRPLPKEALEEFHQVRDKYMKILKEETPVTAEPEGDTAP